MRLDHYANRVTWSLEDGEHVGLRAEFPSLSWLAFTPEAALAGIRQMTAKAAADMQASSETIPEPLPDNRYSGEFKVHIPPQLHRTPALQAAEQGISLNRWASAKPAGCGIRQSVCAVCAAAHIGRGWVGVGHGSALSGSRPGS